MDSTTCQRSTHTRLNICDDHEVDALCEALNCRRTDVYEAVAYVGDYVCCVREYLKRTIQTGYQALARGNLHVLRSVALQRLSRESNLNSRVIAGRGDSPS